MIIGWLKKFLLQLKMESWPKTWQTKLVRLHLESWYLIDRFFSPPTFTSQTPTTTNFWQECIMDRRQQYEDNHRQQHIAVIVIHIGHSDRFLHPALPEILRCHSCRFAATRSLLRNSSIPILYNKEKTNYVNYNKDCMYWSYFKTYGCLSSDISSLMLCWYRRRGQFTP